MIIYAFLHSNYLSNILSVPVQTSDAQTSNSTNVGPAQTSDQYKRQTGTNVGPIQTSDGYLYKEKRRTKEEKMLETFKFRAAQLNCEITFEIMRNKNLKKNIARLV